MPDFDYEKQAQDFYSKVPVIILGSGASAAHGMSGMKGLADHLISHITDLKPSDPDSSAWNQLCQVLTKGVDLESALHQVKVSDALTSKIIKTTWLLINTEDSLVFQKSLQNRDMFPLSRLLEHMFKSSLRR